MPRLEQLQKSTKRRERVEAASTFPEEYETRQAAGGGPDSDELLERIEAILLSEATTRALGHATGIDHE